MSCTFSYIINFSIMYYFNGFLRQCFIWRYNNLIISLLFYIQVVPFCLFLSASLFFLTFCFSLFVSVCSSLSLCSKYPLTQIFVYIPIALCQIPRSRISGSKNMKIFKVSKYMLLDCCPERLDQFIFTLAAHFCLLINKSICGIKRSLEMND